MAQLAAVEPKRPDFDAPRDLTIQEYTRRITDPTLATLWFQYFTDMERYKSKVYEFAKTRTQHITSLLSEGQDLEKRLEGSLEQADRLRSLLDQEIGKSKAMEIMLQDAKKHVSREPKSTKLPDAPKFSGARAELESFIFQLRRKLAGNNDHYPDTQHQLYYAIGLLEGPALAQVVAKTDNGQVHFEDIDAFYTFLRKAFGDPDRKATAQRELNGIKQANKEFSVFYADFSRLAAESGFDEYALKFLLEQSISAELSDLMLHHDTPDEYQKYVDLLQNLDSRHRANVAKNKKIARPFFRAPYSSSGSTSPSTTSRASSPALSVSSFGSYRAPSTVLSPSDSASNLGPRPMDLSAARVPTSEEEKDRRRANGLCLYCGLSGHGAERCPRLKCYNCQEQGHVSRNCPKPRRQRIHELTVEEKEGEQGKD